MHCGVVNGIVSIFVNSFVDDLVKKTLKRFKYGKNTILASKERTV